VDRHHVLITGTGRAGTTPLVRILTKLGLDTGFIDAHQPDSPAPGGLERGIDDLPYSYICKKPHFCDELEGIARRTDVKIDHVIVPMRDLYSAAESRRKAVRDAGLGATPQNVAGGLFGTADGSMQERVLAEKIYKLMLTLATYDIPHTLVLWPKFGREPAYLFSKMHFLLRDRVPYDRFLEAHRAVFKPELIHDYHR